MSEESKRLGMINNMRSLKDAVKAVGRVVYSVKEEYVDFRSLRKAEVRKEVWETMARFDEVQHNTEIRFAEPFQKLVPGKIILINLPGNGTSLTDNNGNPKKEAIVKDAALSGGRELVDFMSDIAGFKEKDCQVVSCYYSHKVNRMIEEYNHNGAVHQGVEDFSAIFDDLISKKALRAEKEFKEVYEKLVLEDKLKAQEAKEKFEKLHERLLLEDAQKTKENFSRVILRGQCFGTFVASELEVCLNCKLMAAGHESKEARAEILSKMTAVFSSSPVALDKQPKYFNVIAYANCSDTLIPTIKGSPNYQEEAGFSNEEMKSEKHITIEKETRPGYRLLLCSNLEMPEEEDMIKHYRETLKHPTKEKVLHHIKAFLNGHSWAALKQSEFYEKVAGAMQKTMSKRVVQPFVFNTMCQYRGKATLRKRGKISKRVHNLLTGASRF